MRPLVPLMAIALVAGLTTTAAVHSAPAARALPANALRNGDLIFRTGFGIETRMLSIVGNGYSHVGVIYRSGGAWQVVHALPGGPHGAVQTEPVEDFIRFARNGDYRVMRVRWHGADARARFDRAVRRSVEALRGRKLLYDFAFDLGEPSRIYCTELAWRVLRAAGVDLLPDAASHPRKAVLPYELTRAVAMDRVR